MTARFKKGVQHVSLMNEEEDEVQESDTAVLISEDDMTKEHAQNRDHVNVEDGLTELSQDVTVKRWKFWKKQRRYIVHSGQSQSVGREVKLCGRKFKLCGINSWRAIFLVLFVFFVAIAVSVIISKLATEPPAMSTDQPPTTYQPQQGDQPPTTYQPRQGAVSLDSAVCADLTADILRRDGSAVDAAITGMLCSGVVQPESSGIGGGGFMTIRLSNGSTYALNFRETAPLAAHEDMFHSNASLARKGPLSVAVPGEVMGMERAHQLFGKLPWKELFDPVIDMCRNGFNLTEHAASSLKREWEDLPENIRALYRNEDGGRKEEGDLVVLLQLADTLEAISRGGADAFYTDGRIAQSIVDTVNASGGIMTLEDLRTYTVKLEEPLTTQYNGHTFYAPPSPSGGPAFLFMLSLMDLYRHSSTSDRSLLYQRLVEAFKFAFAERTRLADPFCNDPECESDSREILESQHRMFNATYVSEIWSKISDDQTQNLSYYNPRYSSTPPDAGTNHLSVLAPDGDAVSVTTTVNYLFGSNLMTDTGIVLNNEMDDFSAPNITNGFGLPPSDINFIRPGKRPLSSTCPTIAVMETDNGPQVSMVIGGAGGSQIPTATAQTVIRTLTFMESLITAIDSGRLHHQLLPDSLLYEDGFSQEILLFLESRGHTLLLNPGHAIVQGISVDGGGCVSAHGDVRKRGKGIVINPNVKCK